MIIEFDVERAQEGMRLDRCVSENSAISRSRVQELIAQGKVSVNGAGAKSSLRLAEGDHIRIDHDEPAALDVEAQDIPLDIRYEDEDVIVINKPRGMVVHPAAGNQRDTLVNALLYHCRDLSGINGVLRPGIVHRIDKDTTGLIIVAKMMPRISICRSSFSARACRGCIMRWSMATSRMIMARSTRRSAGMRRTGRRWPSPRRTAATPARIFG